MPRKAKPKSAPAEYDELVVPDSDYDVWQSASPRLYRRIAVSFFILTILLVVFSVFFISSRASIVVVARPQTLSLSHIVTVASQPVGANSLLGLVNATEVSSTEYFIPASSEGQPAKAFGKVTIYNKTNNAQTLVVTTRLLSSDQILFRLKKTIQVRAQSQLETEVVADQPGLAGEIGPTHFIIPGLRSALQESIYAESAAKMVGGERAVTALAQEDITRAQESLKESIFKEGQKKLKETARAANLEYDGVEFIIDDFEFRSAEPVGSLLDRFQVNGRLRVVGVFFKQEDLRQYLSAALKTKLDGVDRLEETSPLPAVKLENYDLAAGTANLRISQEIMARPDIEKVLNKSKLVNLTSAEAMNQLKSYTSVEKVSIKLQPFWIKKIPKDEKQIQITVISEN